MDLFVNAMKKVVTIINLGNEEWKSILFNLSLGTAVH